MVGNGARTARFFVRDEKKEQRSERAHCGYGVFIHWYQVTRFRPLDRSRKRPTRLSPDKNASLSLSLSLPLFPLPWNGVEGAVERTDCAKKKKKKRENKESTGLPVRRHWMYTYRTYAYPATPLLYVQDPLRSPFCPILKPIASE